MTAPANRAPKFVVMDRGLMVGCGYGTEEEARTAASSSGTIHPIGPALPAAVARDDAHVLAQVAHDAYYVAGRTEDERWEHCALAVIAAHEAGKEWEVTERFAVSRKTTTTRGLDWWSGVRWTGRRWRMTIADEATAHELAAELGTDVKVVPVPTRRRRVKPAAKRFSYVDKANDAWRIIVTWALVREDRKWWDHVAGEWTWSIDCRTQFHSRELANSYRDTSERLVRITTRRRRVVKS